MRKPSAARDVLSIIAVLNLQPRNSQQRVEVVVDRAAVWIAAVNVHCGVRRQIVRDGMVAQADLEVGKWEHPARGALQQHRVVLGQRHFGRVFVTDEVQPARPLYEFSQHQGMRE